MPLLFTHVVGALALLVGTLIKGRGIRLAAMWGGLGAVIGFFGLGVWSWKFKDDWGLGYKLQGLLLGAAMEAAAAYFTFHR